MKLMVVNPPNKKIENLFWKEKRKHPKLTRPQFYARIDLLYRVAKKLEPKLKNKEFIDSLVKFYEQYDELPRKLTYIPSKGLNPKRQSYVKVGDLDEVLYSTEFGKKSDIKGWIHKINGGDILSDVDNEVYVRVPKTRVNKEGWLIK